MGLSNKVKLVLPDNSLLPITKLKEGDTVLGFDFSNKIVTPTKITVISKGSKEYNWVSIKTNVSDRFIGSAYYSLVSLPSQDIYFDENSTIISAERLILGNKILGLRKTLNLTSFEKSVLLGILLGDGSLREESWGAAVRWGHSTKQSDYMQWCADALKDICVSEKSAVSGYGSQMLRARTLFHSDIKVLFDGFHKSKGELPDKIVEMLNPIVLAFWYMDDGSLAHTPHQKDRANFSTYSFSHKSHLLLQEGLKRMGISSIIQDSEKGKTLRLNADSADLLFCMISPYIPPSMQYKLPEQYRGNKAWLPQSLASIGKENATLEVRESQEKIFKGYNLTYKGSRPVYIKTELGNFYANGILVKSY